MYIIIVYDIAIDRIDKVRKFLRQYLIWRQNSVFEGELTKSQFMYIKTRLNDLIDKEKDHLIFYILRDKKYLKEDEIGKSKVQLTNIL